MKVVVRAAFAIIIVAESLAPFIWPGGATDFTWLGLIVTAIFAWTVIELFQLSTSLLLTTLALTILDAASALFELYSRIESWDIYIHILGGAIIAVAAMQIILRAIKNGGIVVTRKQTAFVTTMTYFFTATVGFLYEFWEYLVDKIQYGYPKSLVSAYDSVEDQIFNILGATLVLGAYYLWLNWRTKTRPESQ
jgi:hypothetical protein